MAETPLRKGSLHPLQQEVLNDLYGNHPRYRQRVERLLLRLPQRAYLEPGAMREWLTHPHHINPVERLEGLRRLPLASASELYPYVAQMLNEYMPPFLTRPEDIDARRFMLFPPEQFTPEQVTRMTAGKRMEAAILERDGGGAGDPRIMRRIKMSKPPFSLAGTTDWADHADGEYVYEIADAKLQSTRKPSGKAQRYYACQLHCYRILLLHALDVPRKDWHSFPVKMVLHRRYAEGITPEQMSALAAAGRYTHEQRLKILDKITTAHSVEVEHEPRVTEAIVETAAAIGARLREGWPLGQAPLAPLAEPGSRAAALKHARPRAAQQDVVMDCLGGPF